MNFQLIFKIVTGIIVVPIAFLANALWPWWEKASLPLKILTGIIVLPITALAYLFSSWWNGL